MNLITCDDMKVVHYIDNLTRDKLMAVSVSAWSVRKYGNLPRNTKYVLYTNDVINKNNLILNYVFDSIENPPFDSAILDKVEWNKLLPLPDGYDRDYADQRMFWTKLLSFVYAPCDGAPVVYLDWDALCVNGITGIVPPVDKALGIFWYKYSIYNNGVMVKNPIFNEKGYDSCVVEPLFDVEKFKLAYAIHPSGDEVGTAWLGLNYGTTAIRKLDASYNYSGEYALKHGIDAKDRGARIVHYVNRMKPWMLPEKMDEPTFSLWWDAKFKMLSEIENG